MMRLNWVGRWGKGNGSGSRERGGRWFCHLRLPFIEALHFFDLPLNKIRGLSQVGRVPRPNKIVEEHAAFPRRMFLGGAMLVGK